LLATRADALDPLDGPCGRPQEVDAELPSPPPPARPPLAVPRQAMSLSERGRSTSTPRSSRR
jgi:hypothetical protein